MPLPSSGVISVDDIYQELGNTNIAGAGGVSLSALEGGAFGTINTNSANRPNGIAPNAMSEWYSYDHNAGASLTGYNSSTLQANANNACLQTLFILYYHDGAGADPTTGDNVYSNSKGTAALGDGVYKYQSQNSWYSVSGGTVSGFGSCRSERRLKKNIEYIGTSPMGIPIYHFEYKNPEHAPNGIGRYVGTMVDELQRLGLSDTLSTKDGDVWVDYNKLDIDCKLI